MFLADHDFLVPTHLFPDLGSLTFWDKRCFFR